MRMLYRKSRRIVLVLGCLAVCQVTICQPPAQMTTMDQLSQSSMLVSVLVQFVQDFARQALAAVLF